jgi:hypothetical protein
MSTQEMMSQDRRTTAMLGLTTAGEASGTEIIVPVEEMRLSCPLVLALHLARGYHQSSLWDRGGHLPKL